MNCCLTLRTTLYFLSSSNRESEVAMRTYFMYNEYYRIKNDVFYGRLSVLNGQIGMAGCYGEHAQLKFIDPGVNQVYEYRVADGSGRPYISRASVDHVGRTLPEGV
jgi:hypothetical protein